MPSLVNYQGRLSDSNGAALATADYQLTFNLYDAASGGNLIWGPQIFDGTQGTNGYGLKIPVVQGYFNVMLGPTDVSNRNLSVSFNGANRFVEIKVGNSAISPRQQILSAPFALNSSKLAGADWSAVFGTNDPVNGKVPTTKLATNGIIIAQQIGVGTSSPGARLDVQAALSSDFLRLTRADQPLENLTISPVSEVSAGTGFLFQNRLWNGTSYDPTVPLYLSPAGNVGIGTAAPQAKAHVNGDLRVGGNVNVSSGTPQLAPFRIYRGDNNSRYIYAGYDAANFGFLQAIEQGVVFRDLSINPSGGNVGIGTTAPSQKLEVAGNISATGGYLCRNPTTGNAPGNVFNFSWSNPTLTAYVDALAVGGWTLPSDRRLKENIRPIGASALERVMQLNPASFKYKTIPDSIFTGSPDIYEGFIADELQEVIPSAVSGEKDGLTPDGKIQPQTINVTPVVAVLAKAMQEQQEIIQKQQRQIDALTARLEKLEQTSKSEIH